MRLLPWDSQFFGRRIARADLGETTLGDAVRAARTEQVECLYLAVPGDRLETVAEAVHRGARLVDLRVELDLEGRAFGAELDAAVRVASADEARTLEPLVERLAVHSRFRADRRFAAERVPEMYRIWLGNCLTRGIVVVPAGEPGGLVGVIRDGSEASVELVYVDPAAAGRGLGRALVSGALAAAGAARARVATQAGNVAAQRLYQGLGFRTRSLHAILHLWLDELR